MPASLTINFPRYYGNHLISVTTLDDLRAYSVENAENGLNVIVDGEIVAGDGEGGYYVWNTASVAADNGTTIIKPDSIVHPAPGRWLSVVPTSADRVPFTQSGTGAVARTVGD